MATEHDLTDSEKNLFELISKVNIVDAKNVLSEPGVRVDCQDEHGTTPLMQAAYRGSKDLCELFLASGADVNSNNHSSGYTVLMFAALSGNQDTVKLILEAGAKVDRTNSVGRNAAQMAAFVGQHQCVALINNFFSREDLDYYTVPRGLEKEPKLPPHLAPNLSKLILNNNLKTVKICLLVKQWSELLESGDKVARLLDLLCEKMMKQKETNEVMAMKFHYLHCVVKQCYKEKDNLDTWIKQLLRCSENGYEENQEVFIRGTLKQFVYVENQLIQQIVRTLHAVKLGGSPTALEVLDQAINGQHMPAEGNHICHACGDNGAEKKCAPCKMVWYCGQPCQKLHWFTHKKHCKALAEMYKKVEESNKEAERLEALEKLNLENAQKSNPENTTDSRENQTVQKESETNGNPQSTESETGRGDTPN